MKYFYWLTLKAKCFCSLGLLRLRFSVRSSASSMYVFHLCVQSMCRKHELHPNSCSKIRCVQIKRILKNNKRIFWNSSSINIFRCIVFSRIYSSFLHFLMLFLFSVKFKDVSISCVIFSCWPLTRQQILL